MTKRLRSHEGANAVEFALVLPILVLLLFGAVSFGLAFNAKQQLEHANRESVRFAATLPPPIDDGWFTDVVDRMVVTGVGQVSLADPSLDVCISWGPSGSSAERFDSGGTASDASGFVAAGTTSSGATHCHDDALSGNTVQVTIKRDARLDAVFFRRTVTLSTVGVARHEASG